MKSLPERMEEGMREVGILLIAFAPLEVMLNHDGPPRFQYLTMFLGLGCAVYFGALIRERSRNRFKSPWLVWSFLFISMFSLGVGAVLVWQNYQKQKSPASPAPPIETRR